MVEILSTRLLFTAILVQATLKKTIEPINQLLDICSTRLLYTELLLKATLTRFNQFINQLINL